MNLSIEGLPIKSFRTADEIIALQTAVTKKLRGNISSGDQSLAAQTHKPFCGISAENNAKLIELKLEYDDVSKAEFKTRVADPLKRLAEKYHIPAIFAGEIDQSPHTVLDVARFSETTPLEERDIITQQLKRKVRVDEKMETGSRNLLAEKLSGLKLSFDTLFVGAPNTAICTSVVDNNFKDITKARKIFNHALNLTAKDKVGPHYATGYYNIAHISCMKMIGEAKPEDLLAFRDEAMATIGHELVIKPLNMNVSDVYFGTSTDWNKKDRPELFTENFPTILKQAGL